MATVVCQTPTAFCEHCRHTIETAVANLVGVAQVTVDLPLHQVRVDSAGSALTVDAIRQRIEGAGFPVASAVDARSHEEGA